MRLLERMCTYIFESTVKEEFSKCSQNLLSETVLCPC